MHLQKPLEEKEKASERLQKALKDAVSIPFKEKNASKQLHKLLEEKEKASERAKTILKGIDTLP